MSNQLISRRPNWQKLKRDRNWTQTGPTLFRERSIRRGRLGTPGFSLWDRRPEMRHFGTLGVSGLEVSGAFLGGNMLLRTGFSVTKRCHKLFVSRLAERDRRWVRFVAVVEIANWWVVDTNIRNPGANYGVVECNSTLVNWLDFSDVLFLLQGHGKMLSPLRHFRRLLLRPVICCFSFILLVSERRGPAKLFQTEFKSHSDTCYIRSRFTTTHSCYSELGARIWEEERVVWSESVSVLVDYGEREVIKRFPSLYDCDIIRIIIFYRDGTN